MKQKLKTTSMKVHPAPSLVLCCNCQKFLMIPCWFWCSNPLLVASSSYFQLCSWPCFPGCGLDQTWRESAHVSALLPSPCFLTFCLSKHGQKTEVPDLAVSARQAIPCGHVYFQIADASGSQELGPVLLCSVCWNNVEVVKQNENQFGKKTLGCKDVSIASAHTFFSS